MTEPKSKPISRLVLALICTGIGVGLGYAVASFAEHYRLERNKALVRTSHRLWSMGDDAAMANLARQILVPGFVVHDWTGDTAGVEPFISGIKENRANFPDWFEKVDVLVAEGDLIAARFTSTGTQARDLPALPHLQPTVPNRGRVLRLPEMEVFRVADGKLAEQWDLNDGWSANAQLGLFDPDRWPESVCAENTGVTAPAISEADAFFIAREREVWEALKKKDKAADSRLLADDFVGLYDTGFSAKSEHVMQMDDRYTLEDYAIHDARVLHLSPTMSLLLYKSTCKATGDWAQYCSRPVYVSSLWAKRAGQWLNVFSQDTQNNTYNAGTAAEARSREMHGGQSRKD